MQHRISSLMAILVSLVVVGVCHAEVLNFTAVIDGAQAESCNGDSPGTGSGTFTLDTDTGQVDYEITFSGMIGTETAAHVHGPAPACSNTIPVYTLPLGSPKIGTAFLSPDAANDMIAGLHYVNIHSTAVGGGEIRGQILLGEQEPIPTVSEWGMIGMTVLMVAGGAIMFRRRVAPAA